MTAIVVLALGIGVLLASLGIPLWRGLVPPNRWYGVRVPTTLAHVPAWYAANARFGRTMTVVGSATAIAAVAALVMGWSTPMTAVILASLVLGGVIGAGIDAMTVARRVARS